MRIRDDVNLNNRTIVRPLRKNFSGRRLRLARLWRGLTLRELSERVAFTEAAISLHENGTEPDTRKVGQYAVALELPPDYFFEATGDYPPLMDLSFRSKNNKVARARRDEAGPLGDEAAETARRLRYRAQAGGELLATVVFPVLERYAPFPTPNVPDCVGRVPEEAARELHHLWGVRPEDRPSVLDLLEENGVRVSRVAESNPLVDGLSFWWAGVPFVLIGARLVSHERVRFTLAHELAHLVMHRGQGDDFSKLHEQEADRFAAAFLMSAGEVESVWTRAQTQVATRRYLTAIEKRYERVLFVKAQFGVSFQAALLRCEGMGLFNADEGGRLRKWVKDRFGPTGEPEPTNSLSDEVSERMRRTLRFITTERGGWISRLTEEMGLPEAELTDLLPAVEPFRVSVRKGRQLILPGLQ